jgi:hypothetical protein
MCAIAMVASLPNWTSPAAASPLAPDPTTTEKLWIDRWPDVEMQRPPAFIEPEQPMVSRHTVALIIIGIVMLLSIVEILTGKIITRRFRK